MTNRISLVGNNWEHLNINTKHPVERLRSARERSRKLSVEASEKQRTLNPRSQQWKNLEKTHSKHRTEMRSIDRLIHGKDVVKLDGWLPGRGGNNYRAHGRRWIHDFLTTPCPVEKTLAASVARGFKAKFLEHHKQRLPGAGQSPSEAPARNRRRRPWGPPQHAHAHRPPSRTSVSSARPTNEGTRGPRSPRPPTPGPAPRRDPAPRWVSTAAWRSALPGRVGPPVPRPPAPDPAGPPRRPRLAPHQQLQPLPSPFAHFPLVQNQRPVPMPPARAPVGHSHAPPPPPRGPAPGVGRGRAPGPRPARQEPPRPGPPLFGRPGTPPRAPQDPHRGPQGGRSPEEGAQRSESSWSADSMLSNFMRDMEPEHSG